VITISELARYLLYLIDLKPAPAKPERAGTGYRRKSKFFFHGDWPIDRASLECDLKDGKGSWEWLGGKRPSIGHKKSNMHRNHNGGWDAAGSAWV
jgi:hypothetical protein